MNIIIFEDLNISNLNPFSINHASFEIRCGILSNLDRIINVFGEEANYYLIVRKQIKNLIQEKYPRYTVNPKSIPEGVYLNGAAIWNKKYIQKISSGYAFSSSGNLVAFNSNDKINFEDISDVINKVSGVTSDININYISYLWDCIDYFKSILLNDIELLELISNGDEFKDELTNNSLIDNSSILINKKNIYLDKTSTIEPGCILDANKGPIVFSNNVLIESGAIIKGPIFIDKHSIIKSGSKLNSNILIGPECRIGGEITSTIFQGYSNKQHDGFLGNSFIGEWINLGANTNNSNLKNNYGKIKFNFSNKIVDTNKIFLGVMIGDFTRTGISTMINTGSYMGLGANIFGEGFQNKHIESFAWGKDDVTNFDKFIETIKIIKSRRNKKLLDSEISFLKSYYEFIIK